MGGAQQPLTGGVKHLIGLPVEFHRHMGAAVQVGVRLAVKSHSKSPAALPGVLHIERHGLPAAYQIGAAAQDLPGVAACHAISTIADQPVVQIAN